MGFFLENSVSEVLALLTVAVALFYHYCTSTFNHWKLKGVRFLKPVPFFGNIMELFLMKKSSTDIFQDFYNCDEFKNEKYGGVYLGRKPCLVLRDPDMIKTILIKDFQSFSERGLAFNEEKDPLSAHLFNLGGWRWRVLRMKLTPTFTSGKMRMMFGVMAECAEGLEKLLDGAADNADMVEIKEPLARFTTDVIGTCAFGLQLNSLTDDKSEFREMGRKVFTPSKWFILKRNIITALPFIAKYTSITILPRDVGNFFMGVVKDMVTYREKNSYTRNDFMQLLIDIKHKGTIHDEEEKFVTSQETLKDDAGKQVFELSNELLAAQAFIFFLAGFETSSTTMSFALHELAQHPEIQNKMAEEIEEVIGKHEGKLTYDAIQDMKYMDMVIAETLRKYPPVGNLFRQCTKPYKIEGETTTLDPNTRVFIPVYALHHDPKYYPSPETFNPERFTTEEKAKRHPMVYLPFGEGPKNCIGARFGLLQTKLGLATLIRRYSFEVCEKTVLPTAFDIKAFVLTLDGGAWMRITRR